ncbi:MAG: hypothetical protein JO172_10525 [Hyphomicrobiales bacterium]|nr:hypothetical protein [Hyphomicrobiales bacterium]
MTLKSTLVVSILGMVPIEVLAQQQPVLPSPGIEGHDAVEKLIGNTMTGTSGGVAYFAFYDKGGTVKMQRSGEVASGQWSSDGENLCEEFPDDDDETCYTIKLEPGGAKGTMTDADGTAYLIEILPGNPQKL